MPQHTSSLARNFTRRQFVGGVAAASAASVICSTALGSRGRVAANERITVGMIGCGKMANDFHLPTLLGMEDVQLVAVCEVDEKRREHARSRVSQHYEGKGGSRACDATDDFRDLLARDDLDAVCIATPDHWHAIPLIEACKAGKDVYCEKPLTLTIREAQRCVEVVNQHQRVFQTGSQQRSNAFGSFRQACELIRNGRLGTVKKVTVGVGGPSQWCDLPGEEPEPGLNWELWLGPAPERPYHSVLSPRGVHNHFPAWRSYREFSGGGHTDMGAHHYDIAHWALDLDHTGPVEIVPPEESGSGIGVTYRYRHGLEIVHGGPSGCVFTGTEGSLHIDRGLLTSDPEELVREPLGEDDLRLFESPGHHRNWVDCIKSREKCVAPIEAGAHTVTVIHLGNLAYWHGQRLQWDPDRWQFVDDDQANREFLDYERRAPWKLG